MCEVGRTSEARRVTTRWVRSGGRSPYHRRTADEPFPPAAGPSETLDQARDAVERSCHELGRAEAAADAARGVRVRSRLLLRFLGSRRRHEPIRCCAWCGRISVGDGWVPPGDFLVAELPRAMRERTTDGICPDCYDRVSADGAAWRAARASAPAEGS